MKNDLVAKFVHICLHSASSTKKNIVCVMFAALYEYKTIEKNMYLFPKSACLRSEIVINIIRLTKSTDII